MSNFLYVDNSNVWIEGMHVKAVENGLAPNIWFAQSNRICERYKMDFGRLLEFAGGANQEIGRAVLFGSRPPKNDSLWAAAERKGFEVVVYDRNIANREKKIDTDIVATIMADSYERINKDSDEITLMAGDADYVPAVEKIVARGFKFDVVFWEHASKELKEACSTFIPLNPFLEHLELE